jgi:hypothetical protein
MRLLAVMLCWLIHGYCHGQQLSLASCMDQLSANPRFAPLSGKLAVGSVTNVPPGMLADTSLANAKERQVISDWAAARGQCIKGDSRYGREVYRPPLQAHGIEAENKVMAAAVALYNQEISFGEFNRRRQGIEAELRGKAAELSRQIQSQRTAQEQSDRQAREREQTQREIEAVELQATMARQEAAQAQKVIASHPNRGNWRDGPRNYQPATFAPYRNCYRFGSRLTCTG